MLHRSIQRNFQREDNIIMDILNPFSLSCVDPIRNDSDDKEIITAVRGMITFIAVYQQLQHDGNDKFISEVGKNCHP